MPRAAAALALAGALLLAAVPHPAAAADAGLEALHERRTAILGDLVEPIARCVARRDTGHAAFHGCIDWHSAVHGTWALIRHAALSGDPRHLDLVRSVLTPEAVEAERTLLRDNPDFEMPYGRAWFLRLAIDHRARFGSALLTPMADEVARSLMAHYRRHPPRPLSRSYDNAAWALINLHDHGVARGDPAVVAFVREAVERHFTDASAGCPARNEEEAWPDFMAVCTNWAWLVLKAAPPADRAAWLDRLFGADLPLRPVTELRSVHHAGMNFSRAWGLFGLYRATSDPGWLDMYVAHMEAQLARPERWRGDYRRYAHWVAQFGVYALSPVFEAPPD